jgi:glyoxylase-like metal-dependent hydrolase (beta-lactamase superfamily II)
MSGMDYYNARVASLSTSGNGGEAAARFFALHGMSDEKALKEIGGRTHYYRNLVPDVPANYRRLMDGMRLRIGLHEWVCIDGFGHAPEHIALYCEALKVLISGDMVLPRISSNVSVYEVEPEGDPLSQFLTSIDRFKPLPVETLVLPSHGRPFNGLHERINQLHTHHQDRLNEVMQACEGQALTAMQVLPVLFKRTLDLHQTTFAMGETIAHVHALWHAGKLQRQQDAQGVYRFMAKAATPRS